MRRTLAALGTCLVLVAGCGGNDGDDGDDESAEQFRAQANALCADFGAKIRMIPPPLEEDDEWGAIAADIGDLLETGVNELRLLEPPEELAEDYGRWLNLKERSLGATRDLQRGGTMHSDALIEESLTALEENEAEADALAEELGLDDCASSESQ
jgi:hypothetical protein